MQSAILKILITGATGFVGEALCRHLIGQNFAVRVLLRDLSQSQLIPAELGVECVQGNLTDIDSLRAACTDMDAVIHLAGIAHVGIGSSPNDQSYKVNVEGTRNLLDMVVEQKIGRFIFLSSSLAQGAEAESGDVTTYGAGKRAAEVLLQNAARVNGFDYLILRPVNVYGAGMKGNIASMISMIHRGRLPRLPKLGNRISLLAVDDLAEALILALKATHLSGKTYTVTDGKQSPIGDIEQAIYLALGKRLPRWRTPAVVLYLASATAGLLSRFRRNRRAISSRTYRNLTTDNLFGNEEICKQLGFRPSTTLYQALPKIVEEIVKKN